MNLASWTVAEPFNANSIDRFTDESSHLQVDTGLHLIGDGI